MVAAMSLHRKMRAWVRNRPAPAIGPGAAASICRTPDHVTSDLGPGQLIHENASTERIRPPRAQTRDWHDGEGKGSSVYKYYDRSAQASPLLDEIHLEAEEDALVSCKGSDNAQRAGWRIICSGG